METPFGLGAVESAKDYRTLEHTQVGAPQIKAMGGIRYPASFILHQHKVGICTAISLVQNVWVATGTQYSHDFQYLLQKVMTDKNWMEGSSPFSAISTAKKYGLLPIKHLPSILDASPDINYADYVDKLKAISANPTEMARLLALCEFPIKGYAAVNVTDDALLAQAIADSKAGILVRFSLGSEWWTDVNGNITWSKDKLELLRAPKVVVSGHQTTVSDYDFTSGRIARTANTWSPQWCDNGSARFELSKVRPTEGWILYFDFAPKYVPLPEAGTKYVFVKPMKLGEVSADVKNMQVKLMQEDCMQRITESEWGIYGNKTRAGVYAFQLKRNIPLSYYEKIMVRGSLVGPKTLKELNK